MTKALLVVSNHPLSTWSEGQKWGWDVIEHVPFPNVDPYADTVNPTLVINFVKAFAERHEGKDLFLSVQGDFSLTAEIIKLWAQGIAPLHLFKLVFPTTERIVFEENGRKTSEFKFVRWREIAR